MTTPDAATVEQIKMDLRGVVHSTAPGARVSERLIVAIADYISTLHAQAVAAAELSAMEIARHAAQRADEAEQRLAQAVRAEREACAQIAQAENDPNKDDKGFWSAAAYVIQQRIRARGPQEGT